MKTKSVQPTGAALLVVLAAVTAAPPTPAHCPRRAMASILRYKGKVNKIIKEAIEDSNAAYNGLKDFVERFGGRPSGSDQLEDAIDFMAKKAMQDGFEVHTEEVLVPHWVRGEETLMMLSPLQKSMSILGLGTSIGTQQYPGGVLRAQAVVCDSFEAMEKLGREKIEGKIVVLNAPFGDPNDLPYTRYVDSNKYRSESARRGSELGAVAVLSRSRTDFSLNSPHGGLQLYGEATPIPAAAITSEDAQLIARHFAAGDPIELVLKMSAANLPARKSRNLIVDYGPPDATEMVVLSSHLDSWDMGEGALDDGNGVFVNYQAVKVLKKMNLLPRRTIRLVFWTAEEMGLVGGKAYVEAHSKSMDKIQIIIENDFGSFQPVGLRAKGSKQAACFVRYTASLLGSIGATGYNDTPTLSEASLFSKAGVPAASIDMGRTPYFWYHHTGADTLEALDPRAMDLCVATMASTAFVLADVPDSIPR